jgi:phosphoglycolate phosphatase
VDYYRGLGFDLEKESFSDISDEFHYIYFEGVSKCELNTGVAEALATIKGLGIRQFVLSAAEQGMLDSWVKTVGVHDFFEGIYGLQDQLAVSKVDRARELMESFGLAGERTVLIGDTDHDGEVAKAIGCDVILVPIGHQSHERIKQTKCRFVDSVDEIIGLVRGWE